MEIETILNELWFNFKFLVKLLNELLIYINFLFIFYFYFFFFLIIN